MVGVIRFLGALSLLFATGNAAPRLEIPEADEIPNWAAPVF